MFILGPAVFQQPTFASLSILPTPSSPLVFRWWPHLAWRNSTLKYIRLANSGSLVFPLVRRRLFGGGQGSSLRLVCCEHEMVPLAFCICMGCATMLTEARHSNIAHRKRMFRQILAGSRGPWCIRSPMGARSIGAGCEPAPQLGRRPMSSVERDHSGHGRPCASTGTRWRLRYADGPGFRRSCSAQLPSIDALGSSPCVSRLEILRPPVISAGSRVETHGMEMAPSRLGPEWGGGRRRTAPDG